MVTNEEWGTERNKLKVEENKTVCDLHCFVVIFVLFWSPFTFIEWKKHPKPYLKHLLWFSTK